MPAYRVPPPTDAYEIKALRAPSAKVFERSNGERIMRAHGGGSRIHYFNQLAPVLEQRYRQTDTTLVKAPGGWSFQGPWADYLPFIPDFADEALKFKNLHHRRRGPDIDVYDELAFIAPNRVAGRPENWQGWIDSCIRYPEAYGDGIDLLAVTPNYGLRHILAIQPEIAWAAPSDLKLTTEIVADKKLAKFLAGRVRGQVALGKGNELTYLRRFQAWNRDGAAIDIEVAFHTAGGKLYMTKIIPVEFLRDSATEVYTDATISPVANASDGWNEVAANATWSTCRSAATSFAAGTQSTRPYVDFSGGNYQIMRGVSAHDCSTLPTAPTISAASLFLYMTNVTDNGGSLTVTECTRADPTAHGVGDYDDCTLNSPTEWASRYDLGSVTTAAFNEIALNAAGIAAIPDDDYIDFMFRMDRDVDDSAPTAQDIVWWQCVEQANDPYLQVTYTPDVFGALSVSGVGSLAVAGSSVLVGALPLSGAGNLAVVASVDRAASVSLSGAGTLGVAAQMDWAGRVSFSGVGTLGIVGTVPGSGGGGGPAAHDMMKIGVTI